MKLFKLLCICLFAFFIGQFCQKKTDHLTILGISSNRPYDPLFATRNLTTEEEREVCLALHQPYTYYGCGGQAFAFFSEDGRYVIKFFKQRLFNRSWLLNAIPLPPFLHRFRFKRNWKRDDKLFRDFSSYKTAFEELPHETGMLYVHLNKTEHLHTQLEIIDRLHIHHKLDLDQFDFIIQKRAERVEERIARFMNNNDFQGAREAIHQIFHLISYRMQRGYHDRDPNILTNCGFLEDHAIKIDVGRIVYKEEVKDRELHNAELLRIATPFKHWVNAIYPTLAPVLEEELNEALL